METQESSLMDIVKVEGEIYEMKQETLDEDTDLEFVQVEDSLSVEDTRSEQGAAEVNESVDTPGTLSEDEMTQYERPFTDSQGNRQRKRRLRFSEADDMVLLRRVAALNPYKCSALWKDVAYVVALRAGKNFSVRTIRDHTDLLMNTFSLRGAEACLKRTPPDFWEKKKQLLEVVHALWKKEPFPSPNQEKSVPADLSMDSGATEPPPRDAHRTSQTSSVDSLKLNEFLLKSAPLQSAVASTPKPISSTPKLSSMLRSSSSTPKSPSTPNSTAIPLFLQRPKAPVAFHLSTPITCPSLLAGSLPNGTKLPLRMQPTIQKMVASFSSPLTAKQAQQKYLAPTGMVQDAVVNSAPVDILSDGSSTPCEDVTMPKTVDRGTSPAPPVDGLPSDKVCAAYSNGPNSLESTEPTKTVNSGTGIAPTDQQSSECVSERSMVSQRRRTRVLLRARLKFLQKRHRDQFALKCRELQLERRRLALEERRLALEERKLQLESEKWLLDKKEREEKLVLLSEEREHKMAMERRQQDMIDVLLELRRKN